MLSFIFTMRPRSTEISFSIPLSSAISTTQQYSRGCSEAFKVGGLPPILLSTVRRIGFVPNAQRQRKKVEALFAELKNQIGLRRLRLRRMKFVREQFFLAAAAQNIKRLVRFLSQAPQSNLPATT